MNRALEDEQPQKSRRQRFKDHAGRRLATAVKRLHLVRNLANRSSYEFTEDEAKQIVDHLREEVDTIEDAFFRPSQKSLPKLLLSD